MRKAYIITSGEYSDYHICAVTLDPIKAERLQKLFECSDIEEWEIDAHSDRLLKGYRMYCVRFDARGNADGVYDNTQYENKEAVYENRFGEVFVYVIAKDNKSAVKIAAERRAKYLAEKEGIT